MDDPTPVHSKQTAPPVLLPGGCERPKLSDLWALKGAILELLIVLILFVASLLNGDFGVIVILSIIVTVLACLLILYDMYEMRKRRDFRRPLVALLVLDCIVLIVSSIVLHYWRLLADGAITEEHIDVYYTLDALMLICMILVVAGRLTIRIRDRRATEAESGVLMRDISSRGQGLGQVV